VLGQAYRYTGKPLDEEFDLDWYYYGARYYDPSIGRFPSMDPLHGKYPGWSPYAYCKNNPILRIDPNGLTDILISVQRLSQTERSTAGLFTVTSSADDRTLSGHTLEPSENPEPKLDRLDAGTYDAFIRDASTSRHSTDVIQLTGTDPNMMPYQIHAGNTPDQTTGCILVGDSSKKDFVGNSRKTLGLILNYIEIIRQKDAKTGEETCIYVEVYDEGDENDDGEEENNTSR